MSDIMQALRIGGKIKDMALTGNILLDILNSFPKLPKQEENPFTPTNAVDQLAGMEVPQSSPGFLGGAGLKGFNLLNSLGPITGFGSPLWGQGLDIDLKRGDPVPSPVPGVVDYVGPRGGFGNQVRVRGDDGREYWLSHLDAAQVQLGQRVGAGQVVGLGGATGNVIKGPGGDGSHLDLTVREGGKYMSPRAIADLLKSFTDTRGMFSDLIK